MKTSFTLIEVILAVVILMVASMSFLSVSKNTKHLIGILLNQKNRIVYTSSAIDVKSGKNFYEALVDFKIDNDEIIHSLKQKKLKIKTTNVNSKLDKIQINNITFYKVK